MSAFWQTIMKRGEIQVKKLTSKRIEAFQKTIWEYYSFQKRAFPWRETVNPYHIVVSEVMLQQTQAPRVIKKYEVFIAELPTWKSLADAKLSEVFKLWQGLGYNRRAVSLKKIAETVAQLKGELPKTVPDLDLLPGIGEATASSIAAFAFNIPTVFIETNIRRVFIHFFFPKEKLVDDKQIMPLVAQTVSQTNAREWYYALMDYGAMLKQNVVNPNRRSKHYTKQSAFKGSNREIRGALLKYISLNGKVEREALFALGFDKEKVEKNIETLTSEGFLKGKGKYIALL